MFTKANLAKIADRAVRTFLYAYLSYWIVAGGGYDTLFAADNVKAGVVALAMSVAVSLGVTAKNGQGPGIA